jgi:hypothetical protein
MVWRKWMGLLPYEGDKDEDGVNSEFDMEAEDGLEYTAWAAEVLECTISRPSNVVVKLRGVVGSVFIYISLTDSEDRLWKVDSIGSGSLRVPAPIPRPLLPIDKMFTFDYFSLVAREVYDVFGEIGCEWINEDISNLIVSFLRPSVKKTKGAKKD